MAVTTTSPTTAPGELGTYNKKIDEAVASGQLTAEQGASLKQDAATFAKNGNLSPAQRASLNDDFRTFSSQNGYSKGADGTWSKTPTGNPGQPTTPIDPGEPPAGYHWVQADDGVSWFAEPDAPGGDNQDGTTATDYTVAKDMARKIFANLGFKAGMGGFTQQDMDTMFGKLDEWIGAGYADSDPSGGNLLLLLKSDAATKSIYEKRFTGMGALEARGQAMSEAQYIQLESGYRNVLSQYLPDVPQFYDSWDDYGKFIANGVSVNEVQDRVSAAKQMLDSSDKSVLNALTSYYGVSAGGALAYLLDANKAQDVIRQQVRQAEIGGMANQYGFNVDAGTAAKLSGSAMGQSLDPFNTQTTSQLGSTFASAAEVAKREKVLAGIDREAYTTNDTLAATFGDQKATLASEARARREKARFAGSSGASAGSLANERNL